MEIRILTTEDVKSRDQFWKTLKIIINYLVNIEFAV